MYSKKNFVFLFSLIFITAFALFDSQESFAVYNLGIKYDRTCQTLLSINDTSICPDPKLLNMLMPSIELKKEYSDIMESETNQINLIQNRKEIESRSKICILYNSCQFFDINPKQSWYTWNDPSEFLSYSMDTITITPNMKIKNPIELKYDDITTITADNKRQISFEINQLYISPDCKDAMFAPNPDIWMGQLTNLHYYMFTNCQHIELLEPWFDIKYIVETDITYYDARDSPNYLYQLELEEIKKRCKVKC